MQDPSVRVPGHPASPMALALSVPLRCADHYLSILEPYQGHQFEFGAIREGLTTDLQDAAEEARRIGETDRAARLENFARAQAARPSSGPESWGGIVADVERARHLIAGDEDLSVVEGYVVDLCVSAEAPAVECGEHGVDAFASPVLVSRATWYAALDASRGRCGRQATPAPVVRFACGAVLACEGVTHRVPVEGCPGRYDVSRVRLIPLRVEYSCEEECDLAEASPVPVACP